LVNGSRLRLKESDRLASTEDALSRIGADIQQTEDGLIIQGGKPLTGGRASSHNDHRIAMALAIAALSTQEGIEIKGAQAVNKSYPDFFVRMRELGGKCHELNLG
jgi:3-phosphoshikimate 1-carboxyvinyltransferase